MGAGAVRRLGDMLDGVDDADRRESPETVAAPVRLSYRGKK
jgi:hypothetical protein